jgi:hypothetical protein
MNTRINIKTEEDWDKISGEGIKVVVDPMVFRTADVFLRGKNGIAGSRELTHPESMWNAISSNIGALCTFFDTLILEERIPMYDYDQTFPGDNYAGRRALIEYCNEFEEVLVTVSVQGQAYYKMKERAVAVLDELPSIPDTLANDILRELSAFDWEWRPDLWRGERYESIADDQSVLDAFRYGGLLFSGYAQRTGSDHLLQPKRARLYLATALGADSADDEKALFAQLTTIANETPEGVQRTGDLPATPTFLPYLLKRDDNTPREFLQRALKLRRSNMVNEYRAWRKKALDDIEKGRPNKKEWQKEIAKIAAAINRELRVNADNGPTVNARVGAKLVPLSPIPIVPDVGIALEQKINLGATLGWLLPNLPGHRYRKLLMRLIVAQREYTHIDRHLKILWNAA